VSDSDQATNGIGTDIARQFGVARIYVKDISFEAPNTPQVFDQQAASPEIKLNLRTSQRNLGEGYFEVVLHLSSHATAGEHTVFLVEVEQAGVFQINGYNADETRQIIGIACPNQLFPYAREAVSSLVQRGGFPPLMLQPIDFAALYAQQAAQAQAAPTAGNA
jgi:preprotein translocase subunit SecB